MTKIQFPPNFTPITSSSITGLNTSASGGLYTSASFLDSSSRKNDDYLLDEIDKLSHLTNQLTTELKSLSKTVDNLLAENNQLKQRMKSVETIIPPDDLDVHNINKRIELLARKIAIIESGQQDRPWLKRAKSLFGF